MGSVQGWATYQVQGLGVGSVQGLGVGYMQSAYLVTPTSAYVDGFSTALFGGWTRPCIWLCLYLPVWAAFPCRDIQEIPGWGWRGDTAVLLITALLCLSCAGDVKNCWVRHKVKQRGDYFFHLRTFEGTWDQPPDFNPHTTHLSQEEIQVRTLKGALRVDLCTGLLY